MSMKQYLYRLWQWIYKGIPVQKINAGISINTASQKLQGKKIIVTGGSKGIGYHIAKRYVSEGAKVLIVGRSENMLQQISSEIGCKYIVYDLNDTSNLSSLIAQASNTLGGLNGLVNNAGICNVDNGFLNVTEQSYDQQFILNVKSPFFLTQAFVQYCEDHLVESAGIIFITSERGLYPDDVPYGMTKAAIGNIVAGIARRFALKGIHCNAIAPGVTADSINHPELKDDAYLKGAVGKRFIMPDEIAEAAVFLMSDASKCISGEIIPCNQANHYK